MCLEAVKPRSFVLAQFSEADRALVYVVRGPVSNGGVGFGGTSKLGRIKRPPETERERGEALQVG
jgi:hypothetical protein